MATEQLTGGEAMIHAAQANGITTIFGLPGAQIYPMFDAIHRLGIELIATRHEQGAAYMAMGYANATGRPAAFAVVPGPGVLNTAAALCTAMGTCAPVLCLTGQVPSAYLGRGRGHLHELTDQTGTLKTLIKDALHIADPTATYEIVNNAFDTMQTGRPGPVSVEMCWDTMAQTHTIPVSPAASANPRPPVDPDQIEAAAQLLAGAKNPMIMCGAGAQHAGESVRALAELLQAPVTAFRSGRGIVSEDHPLGVSSVVARELYDDVDVLLGIGSRLEMIYMRWRSMERYEAKPSTGPKLVRIDIDPQEFDRLQGDVGIEGDADDACRALYDALQTRVTPNTNRGEAIAAARAKTDQAIAKIQPQMAYLDVIRHVLPRDGFFVPELSQMGFTSYFGFPVYEPRTYVTEGYQGTLGFGFQTALGVKVAHPDRSVVCVTGDGGFMFGVQELATAVAYGIALVTIVFNNSAYGNVRRDQIRLYDGRISGADLNNPDFVQLAESFGAIGRRVTNPTELQIALEAAFGETLPTVIEVPLTPDTETSPWEFIMMPLKPWA